MSNEYIKANPCHPGEHLRECIRMEGLRVKAAAENIGVSRILLNRILAGKNGVTTKTALALERLGWGKAEFWLNSQMRHDLAQARRGAVAAIVPKAERSAMAQDGAVDMGRLNL